MSFESIVSSGISTTKTNQAILQQLFSAKLQGLIKSEGQLQSFLKNYPHLKGVEFVEQFLQHFDFSFQSTWQERECIPSEGRLVIIANHPLGALDAAALFKLVSDVRSDVKVVVDRGMGELESLAPIVLPYSGQCDQTESEAREFLENEGALIFFPATEVSRIRPTGVSDTKWRSDFLTLARSSKSPILPIFIDATNSAIFYGVSTISKPLSSFLLVPEMYKQSKKSVSIRVGDLITHETISKSDFPIKTQVKLFKKHLYRIARGKKGLWPTQSPIAHPESRQALKQAIAAQVKLGETSDQKHIFLYENESNCCVLREVGRLREIAFRAAGEGTGQRRDIDQYDATYNQLILWDEDDLEIVGAYRLVDAGQVIAKQGIKGLYSSSLFDYHESMTPLLAQGAELGRSFVQPKYWGKRSLDYLWYGIGAFLRNNPHIRYLFGPVSISNALPKAAKELLVYFFSHYFSRPEGILSPDDAAVISAKSRNPYTLSSDLNELLGAHFTGDDYKQDFKILKNILSNMGCSVPPLYKQYCDLCEPGGLVFLGFGVDPDFGDCIDGLVLVDTHRIKAKKRLRYIGPESPSSNKH